MLLQDSQVSVSKNNTRRPSSDFQSSNLLCEFACVDVSVDDCNHSAIIREKADGYHAAIPTHGELTRIYATRCKSLDPRQISIRVFDSVGYDGV